MITKGDLEMQFKASTGYSKEDEGLKYIKWAEHRLFEELNQNKEIEEFMINDCYSNGE